jgi:hypothetical protein
MRHIEDLEPKAKILLHNISKYIHIELLGNTINLKYTEEGVRRLAAELLEVHNKAYNLAIVETYRHENKI